MGLFLVLRDHWNSVCVCMCGWEISDLLACEIFYRQLFSLLNPLVKIPYRGFISYVNRSINWIVKKWLEIKSTDILELVSESLVLFGFHFLRHCFRSRERGRKLEDRSSELRSVCPRRKTRLRSLVRAFLSKLVYVSSHMCVGQVVPFGCV